MAKQQSCLLVLFKMALLMVLLLAGGIAVFFFLSDQLRTFFNRGGDIVVPDFRNQHLIQVFKNKPPDLKVDRGAEKFSANVPRDHVVDQDPAPGTRVKQGKTVLLTISLGGKQVTVPNLVGQDMRNSALAILNAQLLEGNRSYLPSAEIPAHHVISQYPWPNTTSEVGHRVDMLISLGGSEIKTPLPNLIGRNLEEAKGNLTAWGLKMGRVATKRDPNKPEGQVLSTRPAPYEPVGDGAAIDLLTSSGNNPGNVTGELLAKFEAKDAESAPSERAPDKPRGPDAGNPLPPRVTVDDDDEGSDDVPVPVDGVPLPTPLPMTGPLTGPDAVEPGPSEPPAQPVGATGGAKVPVRFVMPDGFMPKELKFILVGAEGRQVLYQGNHKPNEAIRIEAPALPGAKLQIYINSIFIEERPL